MKTIPLSKGHVFDDKHEAARAYNEAALLHYGEFAWLNDIREEDTR